MTRPDLGAGVKAVDNDGKTAFDYARGDEVKAMLKAHMAK